MRELSRLIKRPSRRILFAAIGITILAPSCGGGDDELQEAPENLICDRVLRRLWDCPDPSTGDPPPPKESFTEAQLKSKWQACMNELQNQLYYAEKMGCVDVERAYLECLAAAPFTCIDGFYCQAEGAAAAEACGL